MSEILGPNPRFKKASPVMNPLGASDAGGNAALAAELNARYGTGASTYNYLGPKAPVLGDGINPFKSSLREVKTVNLPFQVGLRSFDSTIKANTTSLLSMAGFPSNTGVSQ